jgi:phage FluMu protein Com
VKNKRQIRALRLELIKPLDERWDTAGPLMNTLAAATPKLTNAAYDARVACLVAGTERVKGVLAPDTKGKSPDAMAYQGILRAVERLRAWGKEKNLERWAELDLPGGMTAGISQVANQAFARHDQGRPSFAAERILVRRQEMSIKSDELGFVLAVMLRPEGRVRFALRASRGTHQQILREIVTGKRPHGDCKLMWDKRRSKWYALLSYEADEAAPVTIDPARVLAVHRGMRNAFYCLATTGQSYAIQGAKFVAQRRQLNERMSQTKRIGAQELGDGAKGHGKQRRYEHYDMLEAKLRRVTHTWCQTTAAAVEQHAERLGCGLILIEDFGGIEGADDPAYYIGRFPWHQLKLAVKHRCESSGKTLREVPSPYISSTCPRCDAKDTRFHNKRTNEFHCEACEFDRHADWVAAFNMLAIGGADMGPWRKRLKSELDLARKLHGGEVDGDEKESDNRRDIVGAQGAPAKARPSRSRVLRAAGGRRKR